MSNRGGLATELSMPLIPYVIEQSQRGERGFDIFSRLLRDRIVFLGSAVDDEVANVVIAQLLFLRRKTRPRTSISTSTRRVAP